MRDPFDMDDPFLAVNLNDFPFSVLEGSPNDLDLVVLANRHGANVVLAAEVSGEWCAHQHSLNTR